MTGPATTILVTGAGGAGTLEIIRTLRETGRYRVIAVDASPYSFGFELADAAHLVPFATDPAFDEVMAGIVASERPGYLVPLVDEEILPVHRIARATGAKVVAPAPAFCETVMDKWTAYDAFREADIPVPRTWLADTDPRAVEYPAVVKPRVGRGSRGLAYLEGPDDLVAYLAASAGTPEDYVVQRRVAGTEYTASVVVALDGTVLGVVPKQVLVKRGITLAGVTRRLPQADRLGRAIQAGLAADGPFNVQFILDEEGLPRVVEVNPRYSTTVALTIAAGVHEVDLVVRHDLGDESATPADFEVDLMMVRHWEHRYVAESEFRARMPRGQEGS